MKRLPGLKKRRQLWQRQAREAAGGSMQPMLENLKGSELTKARVYVLAEYLR